MPLLPSSVTATPRRRSLLTGALAAAGGATVSVGGASGCSGGDSVDAEQSAAARQLRDTAARQSEALLSRYERTAVAHDGLAERLKPLREAVARHVSALRDTERASDSPSPSSSPSSPDASESDGAASDTSAPGPAPKIPKEREAALTALASEEKRLAAHRTKVLAGAPPELARLLASLAAAGAAHAYLLGEKGKEAPDGGDGAAEGAEEDGA